MAIRVRYKLTVTVSSSSSEEKDLGNNTYEVVNDEQSEGGTWKTTVAANATDVQIQLGNVAAGQFLVVRTVSKDPTIAPSAVTLKLNGTGSEPITVDPIGSSKEGLFVLTTAGLASLHVSNPSAVVMDVIVSAAGD